MVTDKLTLSLLSRLADAHLALATSMKGVTPKTQGYPEQALQIISQALGTVEIALLDISQFSSGSNSDTNPKLH